MQGYLASVWAISSVVGPTLGGLFSQFGLWRGVFFVNIPLCIIAGWMLMRSFHEKVEKRERTIDYLGAVLLAVSLTLLILAVLEGGRAWAWNSPQSIAAFGIGGLVLAAFVLVERHAPEPILPLWVFSRRLLLTTTLIGLGIGAMLIGLTGYVPNYLQGATEASPILAGLALAALTLGWPVSASLAGRLYLPIGFRSTALIGLVFTLVGTASLAFFTSTPSVAIVAISCFVIGLGMGLTASSAMISAQSSVPWNERGVVTGTNMFARSIGSGAVFLAVAIAAVATAVAAFAMPRQHVEFGAASVAAVAPGGSAG